MIDKIKLEHKDIGRYVIYDDGFGTQERGRLKSWGAKFIFVVFKCNDKWDNYQDYTGQSCDPESLIFEEEKSD